jgi:hypothetical protein
VRWQSLGSWQLRLQNGSVMDSTTRGLLIVLAVLVVVALAFSALTGGMMGPGFTDKDHSARA